jgi:preprotein translocase subunit SecY
LGKVAKEVGGRQKLNQFTRYLTILLCIVQGSMIAWGIAHPVGHQVFGALGKFITERGWQLVPGPTPGFGFYALVVLVLTAGTMFTMWLGEQITERGIGNGTSLIISVNILQDMPGAVATMWGMMMNKTGASAAEPLKMVGYLILFLVVTIGIICITQATRKVPVTYAKRIIGKKQMGGQSTNLPLKINYSGVMPIIFASAICSFLPLIVTAIAPTSGFAAWTNETFGGQGPITWVVYTFLIFAFAFFWVATMFQPVQISEELKSQGGYIPGIRPGKPTADFLDFTMTRLTNAGALFLTLICIGPMIISYWFQVPPVVSQFFGGTSVLILVGVLLDIMRQVETHLIQQNYDGFLKKGKAGAKYDGAGNSVSKDGGKIIWVYLLLAVLVLLACYRWVTAK